MAALQLSTPLLQQMGISCVIPPPGGLAASRDTDHRCNAMTFSENGNWLVSTHNDGTLVIINGETGGKESEYHVKDTGCALVTATHHEMGVVHAASRATPDPRTGEEGVSIAYHNLHENKIVRVFSGHTRRVTSLSMNPQADLFLSCSMDGTFKIWDLRAPAAIAIGTLPIPNPEQPAGPGAPEPPQPIATFDATGKVLAVALPQRGLALYDATRVARPHVEWTPQPFASRAEPLFQYLSYPVRLPNMPADYQLPPSFPANVSFTAMEFSPDDKLLALATADRGVLVLDAYAISKEFCLLNAHPTDCLHPTPLSWSPDGCFLGVGGADGHVWMYDLTKRPTWPADPEGKVLPVRWTPGSYEAPVCILGEAHKPEAARNDARTAALKHKADLYAKMHTGRAEFAKKLGRPPGSLGPPKGVPSLSVPLAANADQQISRHESPVTAVRWHPRAAVVASAARNVAIWTLPSPLPEGLGLGR